MLCAGPCHFKGGAGPRPIPTENGIPKFTVLGLTLKPELLMDIARLQLTDAQIQDAESLGDKIVRDHPPY